MAGYFDITFVSVAAVLPGATMGMERCGGSLVLQAWLQSEGAGAASPSCQHHRTRAAASGPRPDLGCPVLVRGALGDGAQLFDLKDGFQALARAAARLPSVCWSFPVGRGGRDD